jgi:peptidoglycan/LPS O-acetylase OafA/YrhL
VDRSVQTNLPARKFRPEIQGLRAIGAILVASYHIWIERVSGGIDVFFVISGFLILGSLYNQADRTQTVDLRRFATGLMSRLLPMAMLVTISIMILAFLLLPHTRWHAIILESAASTLNIENWKLAYSAIDYLDREDAASPFQHFWALSIQWQFYLIFGLSFLVLAKIQPLRLGRINISIAAPLVLMLAGSLAYSVYITQKDQAFAYFSTFARVWEFALGGLVAIVLPELRLPLAVRIGFGWLGLAAVLSCGVLLNVSTVFPGYAALWPTCGAALIIIAGQTQSRFAADRILSWSLFGYVGKISYALYLWHWPILIFYLIIFDVTHAGIVGGAAVFGLSIVLAAISTWIVEDGGQWKTERGRNVTWSFPAVATAVAVAMVISVTWYGAEASWIAKERAMDLRDGTHPGAEAFDRANRSAITASLVPGPLWARKDLLAAHADGICHQTLSGTAPLSCVYGNKAASHTIAVVGGSHSAHWLPTLIEGLKNLDWKIVTYTKSSCLFVAKEANEASRQEASCKKWNENVMSRLLETKPDAIFTTSTRAQHGIEVIPPGWLEHMQKLTAAGIKVIAIRDTPWMEFNVSECVERYGTNTTRCFRPRSSRLATTDPAAANASLVNLTLLDLNDHFCDEKWCYPVTGNIMMFYDEHHISATYARTLAPGLMDDMNPALVEIEGRRAKSVGG